LKFDDYQKQAMQTSLNKNRDFAALMYRTLGLVGEAGEVAEKVKKILRDKEGEVSKSDKQEIIKEMGDVLWYLQALADYLEVPFSQIAEVNLEKINSRKKRGVTKGNGDNR
jgi:NTP pyrophosphatase (non-canonical NTP hydrolase)